MPQEKEETTQKRCPIAGQDVPRVQSRHLRPEYLLVHLLRLRQRRCSRACLAKDLHRAERVQKQQAS
jgi:hypothetical protein